MNRFDLSGKTAIVTGSARGLGQGIAIALAEAGADIVAVSMNTSAETIEAIKDSAEKLPRFGSI